MYKNISVSKFIVKLVKKREIKQKKKKNFGNIEKMRYHTTTI